MKATTRTGLALLLLTSSALGQESQEGPEPRVGRATRGDVEPVGPEPLETERLAGGWAGVQAWMDRLGVQPRLALVTDASVLAAGGAERGESALRALLDFECSIDAERLLGWPDASAYFDYQLQRGEDASLETGDYQVYSNIDGPDRSQLAQIFVEQSLLDGALRLKLGKSDVNTDFAFVEHGLHHVQSSFGFAPTILGFPSYPDPAFGGSVFVEPGGDLHLRGGIYDGATQAGIATGPRGPRSLFGAPSELFLIGELGVHWQRDSALPGHLGVGAWRHTGRFERAGGGSSDGTQGYYLVADQMLWRPDDARGAQRGVGAFLQYGYADPELSLVEHYVACGATWSGPFAGRPHDAFGAGLAAALWRALPAETLAGDGELSAELFYSLELTPWLHVKPDLQYIRNPGGVPGVADAWVATLRITIEF